MVILLVTINGYYIINYCWLLCYIITIGDYSRLFYFKSLYFILNYYS
jgi:hypothetical protein